MSEFLLINSPIFWDSKTEDDDYLSPLGQGYIATQLDKMKEQGGFPWNN